MLVEITTNLAGPVGSPSVGMIRGGVVDRSASVEGSTPGAKWTPLYCGGGGMARQQFLGSVRHWRRVESSAVVFVATSLTASDNGRCCCCVEDFGTMKELPRLVVLDGGLGSVVDVAVVVAVDVVVSSANGVGGESCVCPDDTSTIVSLRRSKLMLRFGCCRRSTMMTLLPRFIGSSDIRTSSFFDAPFDVVDVIVELTSLTSSLTSSYSSSTQTSVTRE